MHYRKEGYVLRRDLIPTLIAIIVTLMWAGRASAECNIHEVFNQPEGFRGIAWGTPLFEVSSQMTSAHDEHFEGTGPLYHRANDKLALGDVPLGKILYEFYNNTFSSVFIQSAEGSRSGMIAAFVARFGNGYCKNNPYVEQYIWTNNFRGPHISTVYLDCRPANGTCLGVILSSEAAERKKADQATAGTRAKRDF